jgi:hypothetical protein
MLASLDSARSLDSSHRAPPASDAASDGDEEEDDGDESPPPAVVAVAVVAVAAEGAGRSLWLDAWKIWRVRFWRVGGFGGGGEKKGRGRGAARGRGFWRVLAPPCQHGGGAFVRNTGTKPAGLWSPGRVARGRHSLDRVQSCPDWVV